jgi:hypothetical protein
MHTLWRSQPKAQRAKFERERKEGMARSLAALRELG